MQRQGAKIADKCLHSQNFSVHQRKFLRNFFTEGLCQSFNNDWFIAYLKEQNVIKSVFF